MPDVKIKRGIFQGDSLSPLLFCLTIDPLSKQLKSKNIGYNVVKIRGDNVVKQVIYIYNLGTLSVCLFVSSNLSHLKSHLHEIWAQYLFWANLKHYEVGFLNFDFLRGAAIYP